MVLTNSDKEILLSKGYSNNDLIAIEDAKFCYKIFDTYNESNPEIKISQTEVIKLIGRERFLSAIGRATFHSTAVVAHESVVGLGVYFERTDF